MRQCDARFEVIVSRPDIWALPDSVYVADRGGPLPLYHELASKIEEAILGHDIPPGSRLEDESSLSVRLGVSRPTLRRAIQELVDKGLLVRRRGIGTQFVPRTALSRKLELTSLWEDLARGGNKPSTRILDLGIVSATAPIAEALGVDAGSPVLHLRRLRLTNDTPLAILENFLPEAFVDLTRADLADRGLYEVLTRRGVTIRVAHQSIGAVAATTADAHLLGLKKGEPLLSMSRTAFDSGGRATETGTHLYRPDLYSFEATLVRSGALGRASPSAREFALVELDSGPDLALRIR
jgi:DNA-binding GntR family transcriptional regulator